MENDEDETFGIKKGVRNRTNNLPNFGGGDKSIENYECLCKIL
ncbi:MAG: hypothetical protein ACKO96_46695 [Flammeovirgaceae bacterium]